MLGGFPRLIFLFGWFWFCFVFFPHLKVLAKTAEPFLKLGKKCWFSLEQNPGGFTLERFLGSLALEM